MSNDPNERYSRFRLTQDFASQAPTRKFQTTVTISKPNKQLWVRVHPSAFFNTQLLELRHKQETYLVNPDLWGDLARELKPTRLHLAVYRGGNQFLWPVRLPGPDGRLDEWNRSALAAIEEARMGWVRVIARDNSSPGYDVQKPGSPPPDPVWPDRADEALNQLLHQAFAGRTIEALDHPVLKDLKGAWG